MTARQMLKEWVMAFPLASGALPESVDESGLVTLECGGDVVVQIGAFDTNDMLHFFSTLMAAPEDEMEMYHAMQDALRLNVELVDALSGGVGLSPDERELVLCAHYPASTLEDLSRHVADFASVCRLSRARLTREAASPLPQRHETVPPYPGIQV